MAVKTLAEIKTQITSTIKDNGGDIATQTQGALHRVLETDFADSTFFKKENTVSKVNTATINFSEDSISGGYLDSTPANAPLTASTIVIQNTSPLNAKVVELFHKASAMPTITLPSGWKLATIVGGKTYTANAINRLSFQYFPGNVVSLIISEWVVIP